MVTLTDEQIPGVGDGILMPAITNLFTIQSSGDGEHGLLARQVIRCELDFVAKTVTLHVEQPFYDCGMTAVVERLCSTGGYTLTVSHVRSPGESAQESSSFLLQHLRPLQHQYVLDYASRGQTARHVMVFEYGSLTIV